MQGLVDWLAREGGLILSWWLLVTAAGFIAWPLTFRLLRGLPDRGYTLIRSAGLVVIGYVFWLGGSLGLLTNTNGSIILAALIVLGISLALLEREAMREWIGLNWKFMLLVEALVLGLFLAWVLIRAMNPALTGTEKPMEVAFTSAIQRSATFPPNDPWMSGYAISYYYFGYVLAAALGNLVGVSAGTTFNLMIPTLFALMGIGVFGIIYNLLRSRYLGHRRKGHLHPTPRAIAVLFGLLGIVLVVLLGNFHTAFVELPYQENWTSPAYLNFWDEAERDEPRGTAAGGPQNWNFWWWFRASRVVRDYDLNGLPSGIQPIDEFPAFSFILADMHPHVLALPFAVLALGLALNVILSQQAPGRDQLVFYGLLLGALVFLNTWDGPIYMVLLVGAEAVRRLRANGSGRLVTGDWLALLKFGLILVGLAVLFYLPFLISFRSQLGGVLPNVIHPTRLHQFFLMFGPFLVLLLFFLGVAIWRGQDEMAWGVAWRVLLGALLVLLVFAVVLGIVAWLQPAVRGAVYTIVEDMGGLGDQIMPVLRIRLAGLPLLILLAGMILVIVARLFGRPIAAEDGVPYSAVAGFVLLLIGAGAVLALLPDFIYLRDNFAVRINTVFKFYYQVWLLWGIASTYAAYTILADVEWSTRPGVAARVVFGVLLALVLVAGLTYPVLGVYSRAVTEAGRAGDNPPALTLDGSPSLATPDDYAALLCLDDLVGDRQVTMVEAVGGAYRPDLGGRVSALTGIPTVLAWENHERQWRGATYPAIAGTRADDVARLYNDPNWVSVAGIATLYGIDYIFVGSAEYGAFDSFGLAKFAPNLTMVCQSGDSMVFQVD